MSIFSKDIWTHISIFLCYIDNYSLRLVCKKSSKIKLDFKKIIIDKLSKYIDNVDMFLIKLIESRAIISGGFILACLYDNDLFDDIDMFDRVNDPKLDHSILSNYLYETYKIYDSKPFNFTYRIRAFHIKDKNKKLQQIAVELDPSDYINMTFDMEICKNYFDGNNLYIKSWDKLIKRSDYIKPGNLLMLKEYIKRNVSCLELSKIRMNKYIKKGFNISLHPKYKEIKLYIENLILEMKKKDDYTWGIGQSKKYAIDISIFDN